MFSFLKKGHLVFKIIATLFFTGTGSVFVLISLTGKPDLFTPASPATAAVMIVFLMAPVMLGVLDSFTIKVACGKFLDEKKGVIVWIGMLFLGFLLGIAAHQTGIQSVYSVPAIALIGTIFSLAIKTSFSPDSFTARDYSDHGASHQDDNTDEYRDDLFFTYLNFCFVVLYAHLVLLTVSRHFGAISALLVQTMAVIIAGILAGYGFARILRRRFWHIYGELSFPFLFLLFFASHSYLAQLNARSPYMMMLTVIPLAFAMGTSMYHTCFCITRRFDQERASRILRMALFVLPVPLIWAVAFAPLSETLFSILFYALALLNIILPGLYISQRSTKALRKAAYIVFVIVIVPVFILAHLYFGLPSGSKLYILQTKGLDDLTKTDFNAHFISPREDVLFNGRTIVQVSDASLKNLERSFAAASLFAPAGGSHLVIDGYRSFFRNNMYSLLGDTHSLGYIPFSSLDHIPAPITGEKRLFSIKRILQFFLLHGLPLTLLSLIFLTAMTLEFPNYGLPPAITAQ